MWAFGGSFTQVFTAVDSGYPTSIHVHFGNNQQAFEYVFFGIWFHGWWWD
jgi:hypothetical protein